MTRQSPDAFGWPALMSIETAGLYMDITGQTFRTRLINTKEIIPCNPPGTATRIARADIDAYIERLRKSA